MVGVHGSEKWWIRIPIYFVEGVKECAPGTEFFHGLQMPVPYSTAKGLAIETIQFRAPFQHLANNLGMAAGTRAHQQIMQRPHRFRSRIRVVEESTNNRTFSHFHCLEHGLNGRFRPEK
jgi:hypothetical protein